MAIYSGTCGINLNWTLDTDTKILQIFGTGLMTPYDIEHNIYSPWYQYLENIEKVQIKDGATSIGQQAFYGCNKMTEIQISKTVKSISYQAFRECSSLINIEIPYGISIIRQNTFRNCTSLTSVTIPDSVVSIESWAFCNCKKLKNIIIPNSVTALDAAAFYGCSELEKIVLSNSLTIINCSTFYNCKKLNNVIIPEGIKTIAVEPDSGGSGGVFQGCNDLTRIVIPKSLMTIGKQAFSNTSLHDVIFLGSENEWNKIDIQDYNSPLKSATKYYWPWWNGKYKYRCKLGNKNNFKYTNELIDDTSLEIVFGNEANSNQIAWYTDDEGWQGLNVDAT